MRTHYENVYDSDGRKLGYSWVCGECGEHGSVRPSLLAACYYLMEHVTVCTHE